MRLLTLSARKARKGSVPFSYSNRPSASVTRSPSITFRAISINWLSVPASWSNDMWFSMNRQFDYRNYTKSNRKWVSVKKQKVKNLIPYLLHAIGQPSDYFLWRGSSETVSFLRPFARRAFKTLRPLAVDILSRKPCLFRLFLFDGWNVLFISWIFYCFTITFS